MHEEEEKHIEQMKMEVEDEISKLPQNNPSKCEGLIRMLHEKVNALKSKRSKMIS